MIIVLMGVAGAGKTFIGRALARQLGWPFFDADDFHSPENIARMRAGVPLSDADREPWLQELHLLLRRIADHDGDAVLACSALRAHYRERLRDGIANVRFVYLKSTRELIAQLLAARTDHFMPPELLDSQFDTLEEPHEALVVDASDRADAIVEQIRASLGV